MIPSPGAGRASAEKVRMRAGQKHRSEGAQISKVFRWTSKGAALSVSGSPSPRPSPPGEGGMFGCDRSNRALKTIVRSRGLRLDSAVAGGFIPGFHGGRESLSSMDRGRAGCAWVFGGRACTRRSGAPEHPVVDRGGFWAAPGLLWDEG